MQWLGQVDPSDCKHKLCPLPLAVTVNFLSRSWQYPWFPKRSPDVPRLQCRAHCWCKLHDLVTRKQGILIPAWPLMCCVVSGKLHPLSGPQFPCMKNKGIKLVSYDSIRTRVSYVHFYLNHKIRHSLKHVISLLIVILLTTPRRLVCPTHTPHHMHWDFPEKPNTRPGSWVLIWNGHNHKLMTFSGSRPTQTSKLKLSILLS